MADREDILAKIRSLLARTTERGCTEAEALAAALAAQRLVVKYDVSDDELAERRADEPIEEERSVEFAETWLVTLACCIARCMRCRCWLETTGRSKAAVFYGRRSEAQAARMLFDHLRAVGSQLTSEHVRDWRREHPSLSAKGVRQSYKAGFAKGVSDVLERQSRELMVMTPPEVEAAFEERTRGFTGTYATRRQTVYRSHYGAGRDAGANSVGTTRMKGSAAITAE